MQNVLDFIQFALSHAKSRSVPKGADLPFDIGTAGEWEYLWGTKGATATQKLLDSRYNSYYGPNGWSWDEYCMITDGWVARGQKVTDCQGYLDAFLGNNVNADANYRTYCTDKGLVSAINRPYVIGEAVFNGSDQKKTHVGWICGFVGTDPLIVEAQGLKYGVVVTRMSKRKFKYRGLMTKKFDYADPEPVPQPGVFTFIRPLRKGDVGDDVIELKKLLIKAGYTTGITVDTKDSKNFGPATKKLVQQYQRDTGLTVDGIAGEKTITSLGGKYK